jgi:hypothetical protein
MSNEEPTPQINSSKIPIGSGIGGALAAVASMLIILLGLPELWYFLPGSIALGCIIALVLHFIRYRNPGDPWILPATEIEKSPNSHSERSARKDDKSEDQGLTPWKYSARTAAS